MTYRIFEELLPLFFSSNLDFMLFGGPCVIVQPCGQCEKLCARLVCLHPSCIYFLFTYGLSVP